MQVHLHSIGPNFEAELLSHFKAAATRIKTLGVDHWQYWHAPPAHKLQWIREGLANGEFFFASRAEQRNESAVEKATEARMAERTEPIGMLRIMKEDTLYWGQTTGNARYVHSLIVFPPYNGKGWGRTILDAVAARAKGDGCQFLRLDCDRNNPKLCAFYESYGFVEVGEVALPLSTYTLYQKTLV